MTRPDRHGMSASATVEALRAAFPDAVVRDLVQSGDQQVVYIDPGRSAEVLDWLRTDPGERFNLLVDVTAVDYGDGHPLEVVYQLWSIPHRKALRVKCELPLSRLAIASVTALWSAADWLEREVYDLFGVEFRGHPDLRRILMPENYAEGHPLRKDFPLRGRFSRAEQTRRALSQDLEQYYMPEELEGRGAPQIVPADASPTSARESVDR
ncbi:MAG: NADH-quinone oxidoreductase subunit C [Gammaproteobacteria bacterium]|nr:NADH-quinone oxidoreductase subunit C [Gammaproteobacteria bacterium]